MNSVSVVTVFQGIATSRATYWIYGYKTTTVTVTAPNYITTVSAQPYRKRRAEVQRGARRAVGATVTIPSSTIWLTTTSTSSITSTVYQTVKADRTFTSSQISGISTRPTAPATSSSNSNDLSVSAKIGLGVGISSGIVTVIDGIYKMLKCLKKRGN